MISTQLLKRKVKFEEKCLNRRTGCTQEDEDTLGVGDVEDIMVVEDVEDIMDVADESLKDDGRLHQDRRQGSRSHTGAQRIGHV